MRDLTEDEAIALLKKYSSSEEMFQKILAHVKAVQKVALRIADGCAGVDVHTVSIGSLLHDIGRFQSPSGPQGIIHGVKGGEICRKEGLLEKYALICERHIGAGIPKEEIIKKKLPLPEKDFIPESPEEKIIAHADNLIFGTREGTFQEVVERYRRELGEEYAAAFIKLKEDVEKMTHG